jgi:menaquinone-dependent protoporphyrinogen oxidase
MRVLVGYASAHGSTRGIAERIGTVLGEEGHQVDVRPLDRVARPEAYDALVLGSAVHSQAWLDEAGDWVQGNRAALRNRPVWLFSVGMARILGGWFEEQGRKAKGLRTIEEIARPRDHRLFAGVVRPEHIGTTGRLIWKTMPGGGRYGDFRNWEEIDTWAAEIGRFLAESVDVPRSEGTAEHHRGQGDAHGRKRPGTAPPGE